MNEYTVIFCTVPNNDVANAIAEKVVGERLAACANIVPGLRSIYTWKGAVCRDDELLLVMKTKQSLFEELRAAILSAHPYEVPEIVALPIVAGHDAYLSWITDVTR
ncbi:MAG TPA: divalent-cation tolerance protein CutA [Spirochaetota bacterium]|nr:divalent-cation tolerance protein CutA [Spirochaetota bacterium]HOS38797.1 divalent-cation tolerance protein CutA [Spirochaetota bacterium]HPI22144.1 divalent-cation tolerance protein CutA [Spirochaetota bacterium]HPU86843.1 divalent-cation tolerance protein CutA [Spirochaetota bacterium]